MIDWNKMGTDRPYQDPQDAVRAATGEYTDNSSTMPVESKLPLVSFPRGMDPMPFASVRRVGGSR